MSATTGSAQTRSKALQYLLLALVVSGSALFFLASTAATFDNMIHHRMRARPPLDYAEGAGSMAKPRPEALAAGIRPNDEIISVDGKPFTGMAGLIRQIYHAHAGDIVTMVYRRPGGTQGTARIRLEQKLPGLPTASRWLISIVVLVIFPAFCLAVGYWVVFAKPHDRNAWFVLGIMNVVPAFFGTTGYYPGFLTAFTTLWQALSFHVMFLCLMLLGIYFPVPSRLDLRYPWIKWLLIVPQLLGIPIVVFLIHGRLYHIRFVQPYLATLGPVNIASTVFVTLSFFVFIASVTRKLLIVHEPDARRRLGVVATGSVLGLTPGLTILVTAVIQSLSLDEAVPSWAILVSAVLFIFFPLSLAYTVIVQRALDVRIFLRLGTRYAFARGTLWVFQAAVFSYLAYRLFRFSHEPEHPLTHLFVPAAILLLAILLRSPVVRGLSLWIDRRFFREAYSVEQVLNALSLQARDFAETEPLVRTIIEQISETLHVRNIAVLLRKGHTFRLLDTLGLDGVDGISLPESSSTIRVLRRGEGSARVNHSRPDPWLSLASGAEVETLLQLQAELMLPLPGRSELIGVMALGPKKSEEPYSPADRRLLQSLALQTGLAIENTELVQSLAQEAAQRERMNQEIEIAREVQERLFPQQYPKVDGLELAGFCRTAQQIGGDYYDFIAFENGNLGIAIGDVSGKGISAALLMASMRAALRGLTMSGAVNLPEVMRRMNQIAYDSSTSNRFVTFFLAEYNPATRRLRYVNAGHDAPIVLRANSTGAEEKGPQGSCELRLRTGGLVIGLFPAVHYELGDVALEPEDVLIAYTDGLSESMNARNEEWGEEEIVKTAKKTARLPAKLIVSRLLQAADQFTAGAPQHDDLTMVIVKVL